MMQMGDVLLESSYRRSTSTRVPTLGATTTLIPDPLDD